MPGIRNFGIISELGWDYDVKLFEDGPPILKIVMARGMGSSKMRPASQLRWPAVVIHQRAVGEERGWGEVREYFAYLQCKSC